MKTRIRKIEAAAVLTGLLLSSSGSWSLAATGAAASPGAGPAVRFCADPVAFVCEADSLALEERRKKEMRAEVLREASRDRAARGIGYTASLLPPLYKKLGFQEAEIRSIFASTKTWLEVAIQGQQGFTSATRRKLSQLVNGVQMVIGPQSSVSDWYYPFACGVDGLTENAFYDRFTKRFVICPGYLLAVAQKFEASPKKIALRKDTFFATIAHELSHSIDSRVVSGIRDYKVRFESLERCLFATSSTAAAREVRSALFMTEIMADHWAIEAQAAKFASEKRDADSIALLFRESYKIYCGDQARGLPSISADRHPPGGYRIDFVNENPKMRKLLACPVKPESCIL